MRVTSASASANSLAASAASRALCEPARNEPAMINIFGVGIADRYLTLAISGPSAFADDDGKSGPPIDPHPRRRNVHPDSFGRFHRKSPEAARQRRRDRIGELHERRAGKHAIEGVAKQPQPHADRLVVTRDA